MKLNWKVVSDSDESLVVELRGSVDPESHEALDVFLTARCREGRHVLLDMSGVRYVNSSGLGVLVKHAVDLEPRGGSLSLLGIRPKVRIVVEMLGLEHVFACVCERRPLAVAA